MVVEESLVQRYQRDGAVLVEGVFNDTWLEKIIQGIDRNLASPSQYSERLTVSGRWRFRKPAQDTLGRSKFSRRCGLFVEKGRKQFSSINDDDLSVPSWRSNSDGHMAPVVVTKL